MSLSLPGITRHHASNDDCRLAFALAGQGPLVILMHGWPELGRSWRHLVGPLVEAGYRVAVPDMRGYGQSDKPADPAAYRLDIIAQDMAAIAHSTGAADFVAIGHDWGAIAAWGTALRLGPQKVRAVMGMSVPYTPPPPIPLLQIIDHFYPDQFFYIRYFQQPGVAEAELSATDTATFLKNLYWSVSGAGISAAIDRPVLPRDATLLASLATAPPGDLPFMDATELAAYAHAFRAGGWQGPLNWYRNFDANAADAQALGDVTIKQPAAFLAGALDPVLHMLGPQQDAMRAFCADLRAETIAPGAGHWVQQEAPAATADAVLGFLKGL